MLPGNRGTGRAAYPAACARKPGRKQKPPPPEVNPADDLPLVQIVHCLHQLMLHTDVNSKLLPQL